MALAGERLIKHLVESYENAENGVSKITDEILAMEGMSGSKTRHFYNNLLSMEDARYLEIGTWKGSSVCSAMCGNSASVYCIDNWSLFGGPKQEFLDNFNRFKGGNDAHFIEADSFQPGLSSRIPKRNIYMYDGDHSELSQYKALTYYASCMDDDFILVVDDWDWFAVRNGTKRAIEDLDLIVRYEKEIRMTNDDTTAPLDVARKTWWNGIYFAVLSKPLK